MGVFAGNVLKQENTPPSNAVRYLQRGFSQLFNVLVNAVHVGTVVGGLLNVFDDAVAVPAQMCDLRFHFQCILIVQFRGGRCRGRSCFTMSNRRGEFGGLWIFTVCVAVVCAMVVRRTRCQGVA